MHRSPQLPPETAGEAASPPGAELRLMLRQLQAIEAWTAVSHDGDSAPKNPAAATRELRLDLARGREARAREHAALIDRAQQHLLASGRLLGGGKPRAVLAHRNDWLRGKVRDLLCFEGVEVVGEFADGADAAGTLVAEQPDLLLVEDLLPTLRGIEVIGRARRFAPGTVVGAQVQDSTGVQPAVDAGALAVFTRRIPPAQIAERLLACLHDRTPVLLR